MNPPSVPTGLAATAISQSAIALTWNAATDNVSVVGYYVYSGGNNIATVNGTSYTNTGLTASTLYSYTVAAFDAATNISASPRSAGCASSHSGVKRVSRISPLLFSSVVK